MVKSTQNLDSKSKTEQKDLQTNLFDLSPIGGKRL